MQARGLPIEPLPGAQIVGAVVQRAHDSCPSGQTVRERTRDVGTLLVFDEVVTGFRWSPGGAQALLGVEPDLTALAKILAGGLPGGAVAGRAEVMEMLDFGRETKVSHHGCHNAHPLAAAAGTTTLRWSSAASTAAATSCSAKPR